MHVGLDCIFLMLRRPPRSTRPDTLFPYTTLCRSVTASDRPRTGRRLADLTWMEAADLLGDDLPVLLPVGAAAKAHGPHLPLGTDRMVVEAIAERLLAMRSEEHTSELQSLMRISYAVFCLKKKNKNYSISH